jgi:hypothetical protein
MDLEISLERPRRAAPRSPKLWAPVAAGDVLGDNPEPSLEEWIMRCNDGYPDWLDYLDGKPGW